ncbi:hypothetical protein [Gilvibacter sp.]|uniref:hypothetical protein n=1 Tax=Gilvibacter sp. TaxID=2729997 RepID=UPI003F49EF47
MNYLQHFCFNITNSIRAVSCLLVVLMVATGCDDLLEEDITDDEVRLISPLEGDTLTGNSVQLLWNTLDGADEYVVQIYRGSNIVVDSVVSLPPLNFNLNSNTYQWRVKGQNFAYETPFSFPQEFVVQSASDLSNETVLLTSPSADLYTNATTLIFNWEALANASRYRFELQKISSTATETLLLVDDLTSTTITLDATVLTEDATYRWLVQAINDDNETQTAFSSRDFFLDTVAPNLPELLSPAFEEEFLVDETIVFSWNLGVDPGVVNAPVSSVYEIATDATFSTLLIAESTPLTSFSASFTAAGTYFWRVRGEDQAGNIGPFNLNGKFIVNE